MMPFITKFDFRYFYLLPATSGSFSHIRIASYLWSEAVITFLARLLRIGIDEGLNYRRGPPPREQVWNERSGVVTRKQLLRRPSTSRSTITIDNSSYRWRSSACCFERRRGSGRCKNKLFPSPRFLGAWWCWWRWEAILLSVHWWWPPPCSGS